MSEWTKIFTFGARSNARLLTCDPRLVQVARASIARSPIDFTIVWGWRSKADQDEAVRTKASKTPWPKSRHNVMRRVSDGSEAPWSQAFDFAPWIDGAIPWDDTHAFAVIAGVILSTGKTLRIPLRWGGDWNLNGRTTDQTFMDWGHIELPTGSVPDA